MVFAQDVLNLGKILHPAVSRVIFSARQRLGHQFIIPDVSCLPEQMVVHLIVYFEKLRLSVFGVRVRPTMLVRQLHPIDVIDFSFGLLLIHQMILDKPGLFL